MTIKAFLEPNEDAPYLTDLIVKPEKWDWSAPYFVANIKFIFGNVVNTVILVVRVIM